MPTVFSGLSIPSMPGSEASYSADIVTTPCHAKAAPLLMDHPESGNFTCIITLVLSPTQLTRSLKVQGSGGEGGDRGEAIRLSTLAVESRGGGRLALFAKDDSDAGSFWHIEQTGPSSPDWSEWASLDRPEGAADMPTNPNLSAFAVGRNHVGRLQLLASDRNGEVWTISQQ